MIFRTEYSEEIIYVYVVNKVFESVSEKIKKG